MKSFREIHQPNSTFTHQKSAAFKIMINHWRRTLTLTWQVWWGCFIYKVSPHAHTRVQPSAFTTLRFILQITHRRKKEKRKRGSETQTKTKKCRRGRKCAWVHVRSRGRRGETNQQINLEVSVGPRRTSAVTTHFAALIGDMGLPAGTARRVTPRTQRSSRFFVTEHFISVRGGDQFEVRNHYLDILNTAGVCLFITVWLRMIEPLQRARTEKSTGKKKHLLGTKWFL